MSQWGGKDANEWIEKNRPENGLFRAYWGEEILHDPTTEGTSDCCERGKCGRVATLDKEKSTGQIRWEWNYKNGQKHGEAKGYYIDGKLKHTRVYKDGVPHGPLKEYNYNDNGLGDQQMWHFQNWVDGVLQGKEYWMYTGFDKKAWERTWVDGKILGKSTSWYLSGIIREETDFLDSFEHGTSIIYNCDGKKIRESNYNMGKIVSVIKYD
tara:strand:+ start:51 stop:680 length:630 start_codon:yes stop_codon:yes gene_type:complete